MEITQAQLNFLKKLPQFLKDLENYIRLVAISDAAGGRDVSGSIQGYLATVI